MINHSASLSTNNGEVGTVFASIDPGYIDSGSAGDGVNWYRYTEGKSSHLVIDGEGEIESLTGLSTEDKNNLTSITINDGITGASDSVLGKHFLQLSSVSFGASFQNIDSWGIFTYSEYLTTISVSASNNYLKVVDNILYSKDGTVLYLYPATKTDTVFVVPEGVITINGNAFIASNTSKIKTLILPKSLVNLGVDTIQRSTSLKTIVINSTTLVSNELWNSVDTWPFWWEASYCGSLWDKSGCGLDEWSDAGYAIYVPDQMVSTYSSSVLEIYVDEQDSLLKPLSSWMTCGDNLYGLLDFSTGTLRIKGTGDMDDYVWNTMPWYGVREYVTSVIVDSGCTKIGKDAFYKCPLTSAWIPATVSYVGDSSFETDGETLREVVILSEDIVLDTTGDNFEFFHDCAGDNWYGDLSGCVIKVPTQAIFNHYTTAGGKWAQYSSYFLVDSSLPADCGSCGDNLTWTLSQSGVLTIGGTGDMYDYDWGESPWYNYVEDIVSINIGSNVTSIGNHAFDSCTSITSMTIPSAVTSIGEGGFAWCSDLSSLVLSEGLQSIGSCAFAGCHFTSVTIPASVQTISDLAFEEDERETYDLKTINILGTSVRLVDEDTGNWFFGDAIGDGSFDWDEDKYEGWTRDNGYRIKFPTEAIMQHYIDLAENGDDAWNYYYSRGLLAVDGTLQALINNNSNTGNLENTGIVADIIFPSVIVATLIGMLTYVGFSSKRKHTV